MVDNMASTAEKNLEMAQYEGKSKRWLFDRYVRVHMEQHQILTDLKEHGCSGIGERLKVYHLLKGFKSFAFDSVKMQILASEKDSF